MSFKVRTLKDNKFRFIVAKVEPTKDGKFSISTRRERLRQRDSMKNLDSTSIDHSISFQSFHSTELLRCLVEPTWSSRDGERIPDNNNSSSMRSPRLSETTTGRTTALIFKAMVAQTISELHLASTQDGGRCSDGTRMVT
jgi:hypothetical protein